MKADPRIGMILPQNRGYIEMANHQQYYRPPLPLPYISSMQNITVGSTGMSGQYLATVSLLSFSVAMFLLYIYSMFWGEMIVEIVVIAREWSIISDINSSRRPEKAEILGP
jgi:hypothetical protein